MPAPQLTGPAPAPRPWERLRMPWERARIIDGHPVRTDTVVLDLTQARNLSLNPNVARMTITRAYPDNQTLKAIITYTDRRSGLPAPARRHHVTGVRRYLWTVAVVFGAPALLFATGWLTWVLYGDQIAAAAKLILTAAAVIVSALLVGSLLIHRTGRCPGLHCPGCSDH